MIFGASLGPFVKKAFLEKGFQTNISKIAENLAIHPNLSNMDAVVLSPKDLGGLSGQGLNAALRNKHASVGVIYLYQKDKDADLIEGSVQKVKIAKVTLEVIQETVNRIIETNLIGSDNRVIESGDGKTRDNLHIAEAVIDAGAEVEVSAAIEQPYVPTKSLEQRVVEMGQYADFNFFKHALEKDEIYKELMHENTHYAVLVNMLESLDSEIANVFKDTSLTAEIRFDKIKQIGVERSAYKGVERNIIADKVIAIMVAIVKSAELTVDTRINNIRNALDTMSTVKLVYEDQGKLQALIESRLNLQLDLMELSKEIIEVYKAMDRSVTDLLTNFEEEIPSKNEYIKEVLKPIKPIFTPQNVAAVTTKLIGDLQKNKVSLSIIEEKIKSLINLVFKLCEEDATIIEYQQKLINLLRAQRVEDVVIVDNVIKNSLRIFVGPADTGRTATALTWSGVISRRQNTLLLDLTGSSKLRQYGLEPVSLNDFLTDRMERHFLCIEGNFENDLEKVDEVVAELKTRLNYYGHMNILLDSTQTALLNRLASSALSVHFITDCTPRGTALLKETIEAFKEENIAQKVILIDPPIDPIKLLESLSVDPLVVKLIVIPRLQYIRACSLNNAKPFDSREIVEVFEEAFR
ncbi:hypothetical protein QFZ81_000182 [Paenibacillus sp. V4I9]|uniref:hypothetical protein n=1 Tax=Paenibacillus sp. V4I9 TaxID=3042308 RepID=UPI00277E5365|nr:hypothetical protein [Paenibacillus sp. V4I9]MDQ0885094.1 hypothetical protein [Paenibacillus sp. V4I9]